MAINDSRSMNDSLFRGATDGSVRNMRPDAANAEYDAVQLRARQLHPMNYGTFGVDTDAVNDFTKDFMADVTLRRHRRDLGVRGYD